MSWTVRSHPNPIRPSLSTVLPIHLEIPKEPKTPNIDVVRQIPGIQADKLPPRMPHKLRTILIPLLAYIPTDPYTKNLVHTVTQGDIVSKGPGEIEAQYLLGPPVQPKSWEWIEHLEDPATAPAPEDGEPIKNETSVSLEYFNARTTGESLPAKDRSTDDRHNRDHLNNESIYERDWKDTRLGGNATFDDPESSESEDEVPIGVLGKRNHSMLGGGLDDTRSIASGSGGSPALTRGSSGSRRTVEREIIDVDALPGPEASGSGGRGRRRKPGNSSLGRRGTTPDDAEEDDDIEIIEPAPAVAARGKTTRGRAGSKTVIRGRGKKR